jgi:hypothetical protein
MDRKNDEVVRSYASMMQSLLNSCTRGGARRNSQVPDGNPLNCQEVL